jgi:UDP-N-acetylmuramoyl-tripeptide--D-alanyl-D-alanine ligase
MKACTLQDIAERSGARLRRGIADTRILRLHTDTRTLAEGDCFVALKGEKFDGNDYVCVAAEKGAAAALVSRVPDENSLPADFGLVEAGDTLVALQKFAGDYRARLEVRTVGITGSVGKTSTKEMTANVLRQRYKTVATKGNLNNHIGVPLTLLSVEENHEFAVVEMGMNHPGELAPLVDMAAPEVGIITRIGTSHIEFFKDQSGIMEEKSEVIAHLPGDGVAVLNADDPWTEQLRKKTRARVVLAGLSPQADWRAENLEVTTGGIRFKLRHGNETAMVVLPLYSRPMVVNALMAAAAGSSCGVTFADIVRGLETVQLPAYRMEVVSMKDGRWVINDAYNANADSMKAAIQSLREFPATGRKVAVLGSMGELGERSVALHREVGEEAGQANFDLLIVLGPNGRDIERGARDAGLHADRVVFCAGQEEALAKLKKVFAQAGDCVLVKGSRFMQLEKLVQALTGTVNGGGH